MMRANHCVRLFLSALFRVFLNAETKRHHPCPRGVRPIWDRSQGNELPSIDSTLEMVA